MDKLEKWLTISNKMSTFMYRGIRFLAIMIAIGILALIASIIRFISEDVAIILVTIALIPGILCFIFMLVECLITNEICCRVLVPKYFEKQIRLVCDSKMPEFSVKPIDCTHFLIIFKNCITEEVMKSNEANLILALQTKDEIEKYWGLKLFFYFEGTNKVRFGPYR